MFSPADAPSKGPPGNGESYISFDLDLAMGPGSTEGGSGWVQAVVFPYEDSGMIGDEDGDLCDSLGGVIVETTDPNVQVFNMTVPGHHTARVDVTKSAMYYALVANCGSGGYSNHREAVTVNGRIVFMNPYGHLPGEDYPYVPFYGVMVGLYAVMAIAWAVLNAKHRTDLLTLQHCISGVIAASFFESVFALADYNTINVSGTRSGGLEVTNILFELVRKTVGRLLLIVVSIGYGIVKPSLGAAKWRVIGTGVLYLASSVGLEVASHWYYERKVDASTVAMFSLPVSIVDAAIYAWVFMAMTKVIQDLTTTSQSAKLHMYTALKNVILASVCMSLLLVAYQLYFTVNNKFEEQWQRLWVFEAYWQVLYFVLLAAISWVWRPNENNIRYAYSMEIGQDDSRGGQGPDSMLDDGADHTSIPMGTMSSYGNPPPGAFELADEDDEDELLRPTTSPTK